eukprot:314034_1
MALKTLDSLIDTVSTSDENKRVIGVCGGISSGKSSLCTILKEQYNFEVVNADKIGHTVLETESVIDAIVKTFGDKVLKTKESNDKKDDENKEDKNKREIDRKKLGPIVFADKNKMNDLNNIMWPIIGQKIVEIANKFKQNKNNANNLLFIEAAVLLEANWDSLGIFDEIWMTIVSKDIACLRLMKRNNLTKEQAMNRIQIQMDNKKKVSIVENSKYIKNYVIIENEKGKDEFKAVIDKNVKELKARCNM